jgi:hypothetical protein
MQFHLWMHAFIIDWLISNVPLVGGYKFTKVGCLETACIGRRCDSKQSHVFNVANVGYTHLCGLFLWSRIHPYPRLAPAPSGAKRGKSKKGLGVWIYISLRSLSSFPLLLPSSNESSCWAHSPLFAALRPLALRVHLVVSCHSNLSPSSLASEFVSLWSSCFICILELDLAKKAHPWALYVRLWSTLQPFAWLLFDLSSSDADDLDYNSGDLHSDGSRQAQLWT